jgi:hypothetical protein
VPPGSRLSAYLAVFAASAVVCGFAFRFIGWTSDVLGCTLNRTPDSFLAYCNSDHYGDYEHGAYYLDLEPKAVDALRRAQVLIFGNSRAQFGFSTDAVRRYFSDHAIRFYLLGFGYSDGDEFTAALIQKYQLHPRFVIVDTNPFFTGFASVPAKAMMPGGPSWWKRIVDWIDHWSDYLTKQAFNSLQPLICRLRPSLCTGTFQTIYRSVDTGFLVLNTFVQPDNPGYPVAGKKLVTLGGRSLPADAENASRFLDVLGLSRECVVLTAAPSTALDAEPYVSELGRLVGLRVLLPHLDDLRTFDASHLTPSSAERWSAAIMSESDPLIARCVSATDQADGMK